MFCHRALLYILLTNPGFQKYALCCYDRLSKMHALVQPIGIRPPTLQLCLLLVQPIVVNRIVSSCLSYSKNQAPPPAVGELVHIVTFLLKN